MIPRMVPVLLVLATLPTAVSAQTTRFVFEKREAVSAAAWSGTAQLGTTLSRGNTDATGLSAQAAVARRDRRNRASLAAEAAIARSRATIAADVDGEPGVGPGELRSVVQTTRQAWSVRGRYDRFLTARRSLYVSSTVGGDRPSGKRLFGGGQLGYGVDLLPGKGHTLRVEAGYDLTYEDQLTVARPVEIHSARAFAGYARGVAERLTVTLSAEALTNLNAERRGERKIDRLDDTRVLASGALTTQLAARFSLAVRVGASYDAAPAPRPPPPGASFEPGFTPGAERLDTTADLVLIATL